jgi:hypothetical protein
MKSTDIVKEIIKYQLEHGGASPSEWRTDRTSWNEVRRELRRMENVVIMGIPVVPYD